MSYGQQTNKVCFRNLEFLLLDGGRVPLVFPDTLRMEGVRMAVLLCERERDYDSPLGIRMPLDPPIHFVYTEYDRRNMQELCPNAQIIIADYKNWKEIRLILKQRCNRKGFRIGVEDFFFDTYINIERKNDPNRPWSVLKLKEYCLSKKRPK